MSKTDISKKVGGGLDGYVRRGLLGIPTITIGELDLQYCFYVNLMWGLTQTQRNELIELYWSSARDDQSWVPTLGQIRAKCSGIFLEKTQDSSEESVGELLLKVSQIGSTAKV